MSIRLKLEGGIWGVIVGDSFGFTYQMVSKPQIVHLKTLYFLKYFSFRHLDLNGSFCIIPKVDNKFR